MMRTADILEKLQTPSYSVEHWRIVYAVIMEFEVVAILAVRRRPPYQYEDLTELFTDL